MTKVNPQQNQTQLTTVGGNFHVGMTYFALTMFYSLLHLSPFTIFLFPSSFATSNILNFLY